MINQLIWRARSLAIMQRSFGVFNQTTRIPMHTQIVAELPKPSVSPLVDSMFDELEEDDSSFAEPTYSCIKTQKRRELKMKKHRRQKRLKKMLLRLKSEGKI